MADHMDVATDHHKFIKSVGPDCEGFLCIPEAFQKHFLTPLPRHVTLSTPDGKIWVIGILCYKGIAYFAAGWRVFRREYRLVKGDQLIADYDLEAHFDVTIFMKNSLEKFIPFVPANIGRDDCIQRAKRNRLTMDDEGEQSDSDTETQDKFEATMSGISSSQAMVVQAQQDCIAQQDYLHMNQDERRKVFGDFVPYCYIIMFKDCVAPTFNVKIPTDYARSELKPGLTTINLKRQGYGYWPVVCSMIGNRGNIIDGWKQFVAHNDLVPYDQCAMERNTKDPSIWNVTIFRGKYNSLLSNYMGYRCDDR